VLVVIGAVMVGVVPALKATAGSVQPRLNQLSASGGVRFGGVWTAVIVFQVALSVAFIPVVVEQSQGVLSLVVGPDSPDPGGALLGSRFPAGEYVTAQLARDDVASTRTAGERAEFLEVSRQLFEDVRVRLAAEPGVQGVAFASGLSAMNHVQAPVEVAGVGGEQPAGAYVRTLLVDPSYLDLMGASVVAGRRLEPGDFVIGARSVLVNQAFVDRILGGRNAVGRELRYLEREGESGAVSVPAPGESYEIVGVVENPGMDLYGPGAHSAIYGPLALAPVTARALGLMGMPEAPATQLFVRSRPGAEAIAPRLYGLVSSVDPSLRLSEVGTVEEAWGPARLGENLTVWVLLTVAGIVLVLSVAGTYALMSFSVSQRRREIAIRAAVGAGPAGIVAAVFGRALVQLLVGVALGCLIAVPVLRGSDGPLTLLVVVVLLGGAGLAACLVPVRRALRIEPVDAIKAM
jgi:hypothetical protein